MSKPGRFHTALPARPARRAVISAALLLALCLTTTGATSISSAAAAAPGVSAAAAASTPHGRDVPPRKRPTDPVDREGPTYGDAETGRSCSLDLCVVWVEQGPHSVGGDGDLSTIPALVRAGRDAAEEVLDQLELAGWRRPKPDGDRGGDSRFDLYFADLAAQQADGWCPTDDPGYGKRGRRDVWSFCVIDNDFGGAEGALAYVEAVVAHELFHAVQAAYDYGDDSWLGEATAMWAEAFFTDEPEVSLYGLDDGPLGKPDLPLDQARGYQHYGAWIFFRYLEEHVPDRTAGLADIVREIWERADSSAAARFGDEYSLQAVERALAARGLDFARIFAGFHNANRDTHANYEGAREWNWPSAPDGSFVERRGWQVTRLDHLTSATYPIEPVPGSEQAKITVKMAKPKRGSVVIVTRYPVDGAARSAELTLNRKGKARTRVPFVAGEHERIDVVLVNASTRVRDCGSDSEFSCGGFSKDDGLRAKVKVEQ